MKFSYDYTVYDHDVDINGVLSLSAIMRYAQETASQQHVAYGPLIPDLRKEGKAYILSRASVDVLNPVRAQKKLTAVTWLNNARGYGFTRFTEFISEGETVAKMSAYWGMIDISSRKPLRVEDTPLGFAPENEVLEIISPVRFRPSKDAVFSELGSFKVTYRDCDENIHLNNTNYPAIFLSFIPDMVGKYVKHFSISYHHEARLNSTFKVFMTNDDGAYLFKTILDCGLDGSEARIVLGEL